MNIKRILDFLGIHNYKITDLYFEQKVQFTNDIFCDYKIKVCKWTGKRVQSIFNIYTAEYAYVPLNSKLMCLNLVNKNPVIY